VVEQKNLITKIVELWILGFELVAPVVVTALVGYYLDCRLNSTPWLMLLGTAGGFFCSLRVLCTIVKRFSSGHE
jgi:F0F1-type ATP synthase assembly protein I